LNIDDDYKSGWLKVYEGNTGPAWQAEPIEFIEEIVALLRSQRFATILEPGCGDGRNTKRLVEEGFFVTGLDLSGLALQTIAKEAAFSGWRSRPVLLNVDIDDLPGPFALDSFDAVLCFDVFGQLRHPKKSIAALEALIRPGGLLVANIYTPRDVAFGEGVLVETNAFSYHDTLFRFFEPEEVRNMFSGFDVLKLEERTWVDPPHPGYRDYEHTHSSVVLVAQRRH
jgi:SAM-dependent methyltransferase